MIEVSLVALVSAAFAMMVPFLILIGLMFNSLTGVIGRLDARLDRIDVRLDRIDGRLDKLTERVAVLEERGRPQHVEA